MTILDEIDKIITKIDEANALFDGKDSKCNAIKKVLLDAKKILLCMHMSLA
jgi:hypothetical protein